MERSPLAPAESPEMPEVPGVELATVGANIKYAGRDDVLLVSLCEGTKAAGVFTRSLTASAPVLFSRENLKSESARALLVNSGNANAFTGKTGDEHCGKCLTKVSEELQCHSSQVFLASTGVIGESLPIDKLLKAVPRLSTKLSPLSWDDAAKAIMTTDTFAKQASIKTEIGGVETTINGIAKGSGMIAPDMATMLAYVFTDANIPKEILQPLLEEANDLSFNAITVDSDTSTSDTCMLFATGRAQNQIPLSLDDSKFQNFRADLHKLMLNLAQQVIRDGEGATKLIKVQVSGAESDSAAKIIAQSIANSPLVKTAIAGEDANWGRVVMAVGKSGQRANRDLLEIKMGGILITQNGEVVKDYDESKVAKHLRQQEICIEADVAIGSGEFTIWTCDLTHGYITINADYRS